MQKLMLVLWWCAIDQIYYDHRELHDFCTWFLEQNKCMVVRYYISLHINKTKWRDFIDERVVKAAQAQNTCICNCKTASVCLSVCLKPLFTLWPEKDGCYYTSNHKPQYDRERWQVCQRQGRGDIKDIDRGIEEGWGWGIKDRLIEWE